MSESDIFEYGLYLASLMGHGIRGTVPEPPRDGFDWQKLLRLAHHHNVAGIIEPALIKLCIPDDLKQKLIYNRNRLIAREARQELEAQRVFALLERENIPFIKLKGIALKNSYPMPHMRTSSDVDICMSSEDRERCRAIMESLGYNFDSAIEYHDEYSKDNFFIYEIHSSINRSNSQFYTMFTDPFSKSVPDSDGAGLVFNDEYFYLHLVTHLYKHFVSEGCGLRLFCDLYVFERTHQSLDFTFVRGVLKEFGILDFYDNMLMLCKCFFEKAECSGKYAELADFIIRSGEYGIAELKQLSCRSSDKSANLTTWDKIKYFACNWFPGVSVMKNKHPILEKAPFLLPVFWVRRVFYTIFFKRSALKKQREEIKRFNSDELKEAKHIRTIAGIK